MAEKPGDVKNQLALSIQYYASKISDINTRIRILEEKLDSMSDKLKITESTQVKNFKEVNKKLEEREERLKELEKEVRSVKETIEVILKQMKLFANKKDYKKVEKFVELLDPLQFLTRDEIIKLIRKEMEK